MQKKRSNTDKNKELLERIFIPNGNIAFLDAEFNAGLNHRTGERTNDIISIGLVICDWNYKPIKKFYSLVKPVNDIPIYSMISKMTGIKDEMLEGQPNFVEVSDKITELVKKNNVKEIFTWGASDQHSLMQEKTNIKLKKIEGYQRASKWNYITMCTDISGAISAGMLGIKGGLSINMENLLFVCNIDKKQEHNAYTDAKNLYLCMNYLREQYPLKTASRSFRRKIEMVNKYYQERSTYNSFRRFRSTSKGCDLYNKWDMDMAERDIRIKALWDDIKFLKGEIPYETEFATIQEYFDLCKDKDGNKSN